MACLPLLVASIVICGCASECRRNIDGPQTLATICEPYRNIPASAPDGCVKYFANSVTSSECGFDDADAEAPPGAARALIPSVCIDNAERQATGTGNTLWRVVVVDLFIAVRPATATTPETRVRTEAQITADFVTLNNAFAPAFIRFVQGGVTIGAPAPLAASNADFNNVAIFHPSNANLVALYADTLTGAGGEVNGSARPRTGVIFSATRMLASTVPHEFGHTLGLRHTHDCVVPAMDFADDPTRTGDEIADTPPDPGDGTWACRPAPAPAGATNTAPGTCSETGCAVTCTGGETPDATNFMSYYGTCRTAFTADQIAAMRCVARRELSNDVACEFGLAECATPDALGALETCVDPTSDDANCDACGKQCAAGTFCVASACVKPEAVEPPPSGCDIFSDAYTDFVRGCIKDCMTHPRAVKLKCLVDCRKQWCARSPP